MNFNIGTDIENIKRFRSLDKKLLRKFLTKKEMVNLKNKSPEHIAGIFCAKESIIKACNGIRNLNFLDIEIIHAKDGSPSASIKNSKDLSKNLKISIAHSGNYSIASAILIR